MGSNEMEGLKKKMREKSKVINKNQSFDNFRIPLAPTSTPIYLLAFTLLFV